MKISVGSKKRNLVFYGGFAFILIALIFILWNRTHWHNAILQQYKAHKAANTGVITYPLKNALFPIGIPAPTIHWKDTCEKNDCWLLQITTKYDRQVLLSLSCKERTFKPSYAVWQKIQKASLEVPIVVTILGVQSFPFHSLNTAMSTEFSTSKDSVGAPIFFRQVPLPFDLAYKHPDQIRYSLGRVDTCQDPKVLLEKLPVCGNCHSFSRDGKTIGMDVDYANDKGSYVIANLESRTVLSSDKIITWSDFKRHDGRLTFGLLSQVSPDGNYVMSTVKDRSVFVSLPQNFAYSQLFFPIRGILAFYDIRQKTFRSLPGADDPRMVQSNPSWTPDSKQIYFARATAYTSSKIDSSSGIVLPQEDAAEFLSGSRLFKFDIYHIPFNNGNGGKAQPLLGASNNNMSNYFPRFSPDGKWIVFTQAKSFMLLQPDSKLMIMPAQGGVARQMNCNRTAMNSWHSFSPNGKWIVFSSKECGSYTQLWLTHINDKGEDSPPVLLEHLMSPDRAANIPEFLTPTSDLVSQLVDGFSDGGNYHLRSAKILIYRGDLQKALQELNLALKQNPKDIEALFERGAVRQRLNYKDSSLADFTNANELAPRDFRSPYNLGVAYLKFGKLQESIDFFGKALELDSKSTECWQQRAIAKLQLKDFKGAALDAERSTQCDPLQKINYIFAAKICMEIDDQKGAIVQLDRALRIDPAYGQALLNRAYSHLLLGDLALADDDLQKGRLYEINDPLIPVIEGLLAFKRGNVRKGCETLLMAKQNGQLGSYEAVAGELMSQYCGN